MPIDYGAPDQTGDPYAWEFGGARSNPQYGDIAGNGANRAANSYAETAQGVQSVRAPGVTNPYINQDLQNTGSDLDSQRAHLQSLWRDAQGLNGPTAGQRAVTAGTQQAVNNQHALANGMGGSAGALAKRNAAFQANTLNTQGTNQSNMVGAQDRAYALQRYTQGLNDLRTAGQGYQNSADQLAMAQGDLNTNQQSANDALTLGWQGLGQQAEAAQLSASSAAYGTSLASQQQQQIAKDNAQAGQKNAMIGGGASAASALIPLIALGSDIRGKTDIHGVGGKIPMNGRPFGGMPMQRPPLQQALQMPMRQPMPPQQSMPMAGPPPPQGGMPPMRPPMPMQRPPMPMGAPGMGRMMVGQGQPQPMQPPIMSDARAKNVAHQLEMNPTAHGESYGRGLLAGPADPNRSYMPQEAYHFREEQYPGVMSDERVKQSAYDQGMQAGLQHAADPDDDSKGVAYGREQGEHREYAMGQAELGREAQHTEADHFLAHLHPYTYRYKNPQMEPSSQPNGGHYLGVMAQDVERAPVVGQQIVKNTPSGKVLEGGALMSALAAGVGRLHERVAQLEGGGRVAGEKEKGDAGRVAVVGGARGRTSEGTK